MTTDHNSHFIIEQWNALLGSIAQM